jgi:hypothetical protein
VKSGNVNHGLASGEWDLRSIYIILQHFGIIKKSAPSSTIVTVVRSHSREPILVAVIYVIILDTTIYTSIPSCQKSPGPVSREPTLKNDT